MAQMKWYVHGKLFVAHPEYLDRYLYLASQKPWKTDGTARERNVIVGVPVRRERTRIVPMDENFFANCAAIEHSIVTTFAQINILSELSPIASQAIYGSERTPFAAHLPPVRTEDHPMLHNSLERPQMNDKFAEWYSVFYSDPDGPTFATPLTTGPHRLITDVQKHPTCANLLKLLATELTYFSHWALVIGVWNDFLIPFAEHDDEKSIQEYRRLLRLMVNGHPASDRLLSFDELQDRKDNIAPNGQHLSSDEEDDAESDGQTGELCAEEQDDDRDWDEESKDDSDSIDDDVDTTDYDSDSAP
jgi:hypothetical protein